MDEKNTKDPQTPKDKKRGFNFYWIYGLLTIALVAIGLWVANFAVL